MIQVAAPVKINDVAKKYGVTKRSLRYYEEIGLLKATRLGASRSRYFDDNAINRLEQILLLRSVQFSINDISQVLLSEDTGAAFKIFIERLNALDEKINELNRSKAVIGSIIKIGKSRGINNLNIYQLLKEQIYTHKNDERMISMEKAYDGDIIRVEFGMDIVPLIEQDISGGFLNKIRCMRKKIESETSRDIPLIRVKDNRDLDGSQYKISIKGRTIIDSDLSAIPAEGKVSQMLSSLEGVVRANIDTLSDT